MTKLITRRSALASLTACVCCLPGLAGAKAAEKSAGGHAAAGPHWSYAGPGGPEHWGELSADFKTCQLGLEQTPIDLDSSTKALFDKPFQLDYKPTAAKIANNGHTIQVNMEAGSSCSIEGTAYELLQFHFHHPSEHLLSGKASEMELHLVHKAKAGGLAVVGLFMRAGAASKPLAGVFDDMPAAADGEHALRERLDLASLFPTTRGYYRYMGSLTTPPCSEGLTWTVFKEPIEASPEQIGKFASLFPNNARPAQKRNHRFLLEGGS